MGRPKGTDKLTAERQDEICGYIREGYPFDAAARKTGISAATFHAWRAKGREDDPDPRFLDFLEQTTRARDEYAASLLEIVERAAPKDWKAAAWILERRYSDAYGRHTKIEHEGRVQAPVVVLPVEEVAEGGG